MAVYAVVRIRSTVHAKPDIETTLKHLRLHRINHCVIIPDTPQYRGMLQKAKDYITWGEVRPEVLAKLILLRGELKGGKRITDEYIKKYTKYSSIYSFSKAIVEGKIRYRDLKNVKCIFRLNPPVGGYEGIKRAYADGGALGYRGDKINELLERMLAVHQMLREKELRMTKGRKGEKDAEKKASKEKGKKGESSKKSGGKEKKSASGQDRKSVTGQRKAKKKRGD